MKQFIYQVEWHELRAIEGACKLFRFFTNAKEAYDFKKTKKNATINSYLIGRVYGEQERFYG